VALLENFVANFKSHCEAVGLSYAEVARRTAEFVEEGDKPIHVTSISRVVHGHLNPTVDLCEIIAKAAGMRPDTAFLLPDPKKSEKVSA